MALLLSIEGFILQQLLDSKTFKVAGKHGVTFKFLGGKSLEPLRKLPSPLGRGVGGEGLCSITERPHPHPLPEGEGIYRKIIDIFPK